MARNYSNLYQMKPDNATTKRSPSSKDEAVSRAYLSNPQNFKTDEQKYAAANELAKQDLNGQSGITRGQYKEAIDKRLSELGASKSGREIRGDNYWTDFVTGVNDAIDTVNTGIGNAMDWTFDNTVGNLAGLVNEDAGEAVKNFANGSDLAFIPDVASDVLLATVGGVPGILAMMGKEAFRSGDTLGKAITGRDAITQEELDAGERWANAGLGTLGLALAAIPGIGKARNIANLTSDAMAKKGVEAAKEGVEKANKAFDAKKFSDAEKAHQEAADELDLFKNQFGETVSRRKQLGDLPDNWTPDFVGPTQAGDFFKKQVDQLAEYEAKEKTAAEALKNLQASSAAKKAAEKTLENAETFSRKGRFDRALEMLSQDRKGLAAAWARKGETAGNVAKELKAKRDLRNLLKDANASGNMAKEERIVGTRATKVAKSEDDYIKVLEDLMENPTAGASYAEYGKLDDLLKAAGVDKKSLKLRNSGKFKTGKPQLHPLQPAAAVRRDLATSSNQSLLNAQNLTNAARADNFLKAVEEFEKANADIAARKAAGENVGKIANPYQWVSNYKLANALQPSGKLHLVKDIAGRAGVATVGGTLASAANGGSANPVGAAADAIAYANEGLDSGQTRAGSYLAALMPFMTGKRYAYSALPGVTGRLASYHPYGAIYGKDVMHSMADDKREQPRQSSSKAAYENVSNVR